MPFEATLPFSALVGQDPMKRALLLNAVDPAIRCNSTRWALVTGNAGAVTIAMTQDYRTISQTER